MANSEKETQSHIDLVRRLMWQVIFSLITRLKNHDKTKLEQPEKEVFDRYTPYTRNVQYGSKEYWDVLNGMSDGLSHHYENNDHHPEYHEDGVSGMSLLSLLEMFVDWYASSLRGDSNNFRNSLEVSKQRFKISDQLYQILINTGKELGWYK